MAVYDRWHRAPEPGDEPCKCGRGRNKLYPSAGHLKGDRWQVRWRDPATGRQVKQNFALRDPEPGEAADPDRHASAKDKAVQGAIVTRTYRDPKAGLVTLREYAEQWRAARKHGESAAANLEARLRLHVYPDSGGKRTPRGGVAIGQHPMALLEQRPSLVAAWVAAIPLAQGSARLVVGDVSAVFRAAIADGVVGSDPTKSGSVDRPGKGGHKAQPLSAAEVAGIAAQLPARYRILPELGVATGARRMEMCAMGAGDIVRGPKPKVRVLRQLKVIGGQLRFAPIKNRTPHDVPVPAELVERLDAHLQAFPPATVTLPWHEPGSKLHGQPVPVQLLLSQPDGQPVTRNCVETFWTTAVTAWRAPRTPGGKRVRSARGYGIHRTRHTAASGWLRDGIDVARVASWLGDTIEVVTRTYLHLMPDDHDGDDAGRLASAAFLNACALAVPYPEPKQASGLMRAI